jgi:protocatechuate 3,4-dioxygenase beta subunit
MSKIIKRKIDWSVLTAGSLVLLGVGFVALKVTKQDVANPVQTIMTSSTEPSATTTQSAGEVLLASSKVAKATASTVSQKPCDGTLTKAETEGPYYKKGSPSKTDFVTDDPTGEVIVISGYVYDSACKPVPNAYLDLWHANSAGAYDNSGYTLRGHFQADANGYYSVRTVIAGKYPSRTEHWHIKVARDSSLSGSLTTQLFPPGGQSQEGDSIFDASLLVNDFTKLADGTRTASFNFVIK